MRSCSFGGGDGGLGSSDDNDDVRRTEDKVDASWCFGGLSKGLSCADEGPDDGGPDGGPIESI